MATRANYVKIGLFVVLGFAAALALAVSLGATGTRRVTVAFYTYFNESVQGLEVGEPVTFRGVSVGHVGAITIAPDRRLGEAQPARRAAEAQVARDFEKGAQFVPVGFSAHTEMYS